MKAKGITGIKGLLLHKQTAVNAALPSAEDEPGSDWTFFRKALFL